MAKTFSTVTSNNTFQTWLNRTNEMVSEFANVVTVGGDDAQGNAVVNGTISAQTIFVATELSGGEIGTAANLIIASELSVQNSMDISSVLTINGNTTFNSNLTLAASNVNLGAIANLYITASPTGVQDYLAVNSATGQIFLQTISERIGLDDLTNVDFSTPGSNAVIAYDSATGNTAAKTFADLADEILAAGYGGVALENTATAYAPGANGIAIGYNSNATGSSTVAIGQQANTNGNQSIAIGGFSNTALNGVSVGHNTSANTGGVAAGWAAKANSSSVAIGTSSNAHGFDSIAIGNGSDARSNNCIAIGENANAETNSAIAFGESANVRSTGAIGIGRLANVATLSTYSIAIGYGSVIGGSTPQAVALGANSTSTGDYGIAVGRNANVSGNYGIAIGDLTVANAVSAISVGTAAKSNAINGIAIGSSANCTAERAIALGHFSQATTANTIYLGANSSFFVDIPSLVSSNVVPSANVTHDLGSSTLWWDDMWVQNVISTHIQSDDLVSDNLIVDANTLVVNSSSSRVGVGMTAPDAAMEIDGDLLVSGDVTSGYTSDQRLKENVTLIEDPLTIVNGLRGVNFDWIDGIDENFSKFISPKQGHDIGVIAQEVEAVLPEAVRLYPDGYKGVDYTKIVPVLIEAVKHLNNRVQELESQVTNNGNES